MRLRHVAAALLGLGVILVAYNAMTAAPPDTGPDIEVNDGTIQVSATVGGIGSWVPYTMTVRNLGDHSFEGDLLLVNHPLPGGPSATTVAPIAGGLAGRAPGSVDAVAPPDAAFQVHLRLDGRHRRVVSLTAPNSYSHAEVVDLAGRTVAEVPILDRNVLAVAAVSDSEAVADSLAQVRFGELGVRVTTYDRVHPLPSTAIGLAGLTAIVIDGTDTSRLSAAQRTALRDFVGFGGTLVVAGGRGLGPALSGLPVELAPVYPGEAYPASLQNFADLGLRQAPPVSTIVAATVVAPARAVVSTSTGRPLEVELAYGSGRTVALLFDPVDPDLARAGIATLAWTAAIGRGLEHLPGNLPGGGTLIQPDQIPPQLLPKPSDAPLPATWIVLLLFTLYILVVGPATFLSLRTAGRATLFWVAAPLLAVGFSGIAYAAGQSVQGGVRDRQVEFLKLAPGGAVSTLSYHGITFPLRGAHRVDLPEGSLAAPLTLGYQTLKPGCDGCPFQVAGLHKGVKEHVVPGTRAAVMETGIVYGSVRVVGEAAVGSQPIHLETHLSTASDMLVGTIANRGSKTVRGVRVYAYIGDGVRWAFVAGTLQPGAVTSFETSLTRVNDFVVPAPGRATLYPGAVTQLIANLAAERSLSRIGQVAVVGFVDPDGGRLTVDGRAPDRDLQAAVVQLASVETARGNLGSWVFPRLVSALPDPRTPSGFVSTYDLEAPAISGQAVFRYDNNLYSNVEIFDWADGGWRSAGFVEDSRSPLVALTAIRPAELRGGAVRVRLHEPALSWGRELVLRFPDEMP